ncbi:MAG: beta-glucosidase [Candidatus Eisenbacteria bacterium]|nr:beta-glucosidase [Candidatus Eisenbacteria bacterium]
MSRRSFPEGFLWGVATSAQQIEGSPSAGGRGESIWDVFASVPGNIEDGSNPGTACDHYRRWREDLELMKRLGIGAYRFSVSWPRVFPDGGGTPNPAGLDFYEALVDGLLEEGIVPFLTLNHWDLPRALQDRGGWPERSTVGAFVDYAAAVAERLGDRVRHWTTHNEPWCVATLGYEEGAHAPGRRNPEEALRTAHHLLLSHGRAAAAIRRIVPETEVGIVLNLSPAWPETESERDRDAARWFDGFFNRWYLDPLFRGRYPEDAIADRVARGHLPPGGLPFLREGDLEEIHSPLDFLGVNYYSRTMLRADENGRPVGFAGAPEEELDLMGWEVFPRGLHDILLRVHREYGPPAVYITENGTALPDEPDGEGWIRDERRVDYMRRHLAEAHRAIEAGVPLRGYFAWTLMDNFEWGHGYTKRFGLFHVDFRTGERTAKESARWYRDVAAANAVDGRD